MRPVQVKGKYPESDKTDKQLYGYVGRLTQLHDEMVLAIPYFPVARDGIPPMFIAYMPRTALKPHPRGFRCSPARFRNGGPQQRRDYSCFFDENGMKLLESPDWKNTMVTEKDE